MSWQSVCYKEVPTMKMIITSHLKELHHGVSVENAGTWKTQWSVCVVKCGHVPPQLMYSMTHASTGTFCQCALLTGVISMEMRWNLHQLIIGKLPTASTYCTVMDIWGGGTEGLRHHVQYGRSVTATLHQITIT